MPSVFWNIGGPGECVLNDRLKDMCRMSANPFNVDYRKSTISTYSLFLLVLALFNKTLLFAISAFWPPAHRILNWHILDYLIKLYHGCVAIVGCPCPVSQAVCYSCNDSWLWSFYNFVMSNINFDYMVNTNRTGSTIQNRVHRTRPVRFVI